MRVELLVVEFAGLPGAGKTTVAARAAELLRQRGRQPVERAAVCRAPSGRLAHYRSLFGFFLGHPQVIGRAVRYGWSVRPRRLWRLRDALKVAAWAPRLARARQDGRTLVLLDQGVVQQAWCPLVGGTLADADSLPRALAPVLELPGLRFAWVEINVPAERAARRIAQRPTDLSPFDRLPQSEAERRLRASEGQLERVLEVATGLTGGPSRRLDGEGLVEDTARSVVRFVEDQTESSGSHG